MAKKKTSKKTAKKKTSKAAAPPEMLLVGSKVKAQLKAAGCNSSADAIQGLNMWVHWLTAQAAKRAEANGRKTVRAHDFMVP